MSFRDTFTKDESTKDAGLLGYDDTAFYYFASTMLLVIVVPWTYSVIYNIIFPGKAEIEKNFPKKSKGGSTFKYCSSSAMVAKLEDARKRAKVTQTGSFMGTVFWKGLLVGAWLTLYFLQQQMGGETEIKRFDPFQILEVSSGSSAADIKKSYRRLSLIYHPDKNPDDPLAQSKFIQITKAYATLTDDTARQNYEKWGNPDGREVSKVGIGLPRFLLEKENHLIILCAFFFVLIFALPMTFICYYQRTKNYATNGVMIETSQFLVHYILESSRVKNCPELLAASAESRGMITRATDNTAMKPLSQQVTEHCKRRFVLPIIVKNQFLIWAHMQRLHHLMTPELREDCNELMRFSVKVTQAMIEVACMREWFITAQAMIEFRRCLVQALDVKSSQLLQIPHFDEEALKHCHRGKNAVSTLSDFLQKDPEQRKGISKMEPQQLCDVEAFCAHVSDMELRATIEVEDETEIVVGDVATVTCQLVRKNLKEGEAMGPVHAPLFPEPKFEEWWVFLGESSPSTLTRIITYERVRDTERVHEEKLRFQITRPGKHSMVLHALCDSYAGIDQKVEINFTALTEDEVKREIKIHQEDEDLDLQPTLFQQFMGELGKDEESEEEEEEDEGGSKKVKEQARDLGGKDEKEDSDSDSSSSDEDEKKGGKSSSSDSD